MSDDLSPEAREFLDQVSEHDFSVGTEHVADAYEILSDVTDEFTNVTEDTVADAVSQDRTVVEEVLRMMSVFYSKDSWANLVEDELPLENKSKPAVFNEIQRRVTDDEFKTLFYDFITDIQGDDLRGDRDEFEHWDVVEARYLVGAGSAKRGQATGDWLEDKVQDDVLEAMGLVEGEHFAHVGGRDEVTIRGETFEFEKGPDFVIPSLNDARILIEAKAYVSSTGSKQTDVLGDVSKLSNMAQRGLDFYLVLDGPMWRRRTSDLEAIFRKREADIISDIYQVETLDAMKEEIAEKIDELDLDVQAQATVSDYTPD